MRGLLLCLRILLSSFSWLLDVVCASDLCPKLNKKETVACVAVFLESILFCRLFRHALFDVAFAARATARLFDTLRSAAPLLTEQGVRPAPTAYRPLALLSTHPPPCCCVRQRTTKHAAGRACRWRRRIRCRAAQRAASLHVGASFSAQTVQHQLQRDGCVAFRR